MIIMCVPLYFSVCPLRLVFSQELDSCSRVVDYGFNLCYILFRSQKGLLQIKYVLVLLFYIKHNNTQ